MCDSLLSHWGLPLPEMDFWKDKLSPGQDPSSGN